MTVLTSRQVLGQEGIALVAVLLAGMLLLALGLALLLTSNTETKIAANASSARQAVYAADAAIERARLDLASTPNWTTVLAGGTVPECAQTMSTFAATSCGGASLLVVALPGTSQTLDLRAATDALQARSDARNLWGANDPVWRLYAFGPVASLVADPPAWSPLYVALWVADDPSETDGVPSVDSNGILALHAEAYGPAGTERSIDATIARPPAGRPGTRLLSWRLEP